MILRFVLLLALIGAVGMNLWDTLKAPSPEAAAAILQRTPEKVERAREVVQPVVEFMAAQTPASIAQLAKEADVDVRSRLKEFPVEALDPAIEQIKSALPLQVDIDGGGGPRPPASGPPGIDWYRDGEDPRVDP